MKISLSTGLYYNKNYKDILKLISRTKFRSIELFLNQAFIDVPLSEIEKSVSEYNLHVSSIHTPPEFLTFPKKQSERYWIDKAEKMAQNLGAEVINSHMVVGKYFENTDKTLNEIHKENIINMKNNKNITVTTENLPFYAYGAFSSDIDDFKEFVLKNEVPVTLDITHRAANNADIIKNFKSIEKYIKNIHLSDYSENSEHKMLGEGRLDIKGFLKYLKECHYHGLLTVEYDFEDKNRNNIQNDEEAVLKINQTYEMIKTYI